MCEEVLIDEDSLVMPFCMKSAALLHIDGNQPDQCQYYHGDKSSQFAHDDGKHDKAYKRSSDGTCGIHEESSLDSHKLQGALKPLEDRITIAAHRSLFEEHGQCLRHGDEGDTATDGHHDCLLHVLVAILQFEEHVEGTDKHNDGCDGFHQIGHRGLVR